MPGQPGNRPGGETCEEEIRPGGRKARANENWRRYRGTGKFDLDHLLKGGPEKGLSGGRRSTTNGIRQGSTTDPACEDLGGRREKKRAG